MLRAMAERSEAVLITGCSSGIGRATALRLARSGWTVYASARRPQTLVDLADAGCRTLALDVTDEQSMSAAVASVEQAEGAVGVLINNAGYSQSGAIETVPMDAVRRQFETNYFGVVRLTQLVLGKMRALRRRRPPTRITITPSAKITIATRRLLSDRAWDAAMRAQFPQPG